MAKELSGNLLPLGAPVEEDKKNQEAEESNEGEISQASETPNTVDDEPPLIKLTTEKFEEIDDAAKKFAILFF